MKRVSFALLALSSALVASNAPLFSASPSIDPLASAAGKSAILPEDALNAFFGDIDAKSTTLATPTDEDAAEAPAFPQRERFHQRIAARLAKIDDLRKRGAAGENNRGFLEPHGAPSNVDQAVISEENTDRLGVYEGIAEQTRTHVDIIGRQRAEKIGIMARRGVWVQDRAGNWAQKI